MATNENDRRGGFGAALPLPSARLKLSQPSRHSFDFEVEIGKRMRAMYDDLLQQPIPDRFVELLKKIDQPRENKSR